MTPITVIKFTERVISTHTLTWSVTMKQKLAKLIDVISTHTLTWSVKNDTAYTDPVTFISTHTLTWSVTQHYLPFYPS